MKTHALLWSHSKNSLRVESVDDMLTAGRVAYTSNEPTDYVPVLIGTHDEVRAAADASRHTLASRMRTCFAEASDA